MYIWLYDSNVHVHAFSILFEKSVKFGRVCPFFFSVSYNVCPSRIKRYSMFYKMKDTRWNSLIQASTTLQRFKFFVTLIYLDIYYILYVLFQCKVRYIIIMYLFTNDKIFGDILPDAMQTFSSLDPRVLIKESGSGISWKEKKRKK